MTARSPRDHLELEALFQAARQIESTLIRERSQNAQSLGEHEALRARHTKELDQARLYARKLLVRDEEMRKHIAAAHTKLQADAQRIAQLQHANVLLSAEIKDQGRRKELDLTAARTSYEHIKQKCTELEKILERIKPELSRGREDLERAQADVLEREHRYQTSLLSYQGRDRNQQDAIQAFKDQLKRTQDELSQYKARWIDTERQRQEAEKTAKEAESALRRQIPAMDRLKELEVARQTLEQKLLDEKRERQRADQAARVKHEEKEAAVAANHALERRLAATEARLAHAEDKLENAQAEAALLRAARKNQVRPSPLLTEEQDRPARAPTQAPPAQRAYSSLRHMDLDTLEKLALPGYPVQD